MSDSSREKTRTSKEPKMGPGRGRGPGGGMHMRGPVEKPKNFKKTFRRLLKYLKPRRTTLIVVFFMAILASLFNVIAPKVLGTAIDSIYEGVVNQKAGGSEAIFNVPLLGQILLTLIGVYLLSSFFTYIMQYLMAGVAQKTGYDMRKEVKDKLTRLPLNYYDSHSHGDILSRVTNDLDNISSTLQQSITQLITSVISLVGVIIMMLTISPLLTLITILTLPLSIIAIKAIAKKSQVFFGRQQKTLGELNGHIEEMYTGHKIVKAYGHEEDSIKTFNNINEKLYGAGWKAQFMSGMIMPIMSFVNNLGYVLVTVAGGIFVARGIIGLGDIQAFIQYSRQFGQPIAQISNIANIIQSTIASAERVFEVMDEKEYIPDNKDAQALPPLEGRVSFEHVAFSYKKDSPLMSDINIEAHKGQSIAIVGPTGAGKTTLVNLLMRFYEIDKGRILIDDTNIVDIKRQDLRHVFGMVLQDTWLFNGTIKDNIAYGKDSATNEEVFQAAKTANADHFIRTLPDGYETILNEEASNISQGQKQLITIARAILANPAIMILDEATSSVDTRTEVHIQQAMTELMKGRTNFVIAHRLSTIKEADLILVIKDGDIIEQGNHENLMSLDSYYAELYNSQFTAKEGA